MPDTVQTVGALQVVTRTTHVRRRSENAWTVRESYAILQSGKPLELGAVQGLYGDKTAPTTTINAVFILPKPVGLSDIVVNVGDPNNASAFYLIRQQGPAVESSLICKTLGGDSAVAWFDGPHARHGSTGLYVGPQNAKLDGGRMLLLGSQCLYDVVSRQAHLLPGMRGDVSAWASVAPLGTSPDGRSIVRFGSRRIDGVDQMRVFIADLVEARWSELPVDPLRMRFANHELLDNVWLLHHFVWIADDHRVFRLEERKNFRTLPFQGRLMSNNEYRIARWNPRHEEVLSAFLVRRLHAEPLPSLPSSTATPRFLLDGLPIHVASAGFYVPSNTGSPEQASRLIRKVADLFDQELATGAYDAFFRYDLE